MWYPLHYAIGISCLVEHGHDALTGMKEIKEILFFIASMAIYYHLVEGYVIVQPVTVIDKTKITSKII